MTKVYFHTLIKSIKKSWCEKVETGAKRMGWEVKDYLPHHKIKEDDILIIWNRHNIQDEIATKFENVGAKVFTLENPYLKNKDHANYISVGLNYHNNIDHAPKLLDHGERFAQMGYQIQPWRTSGKHILYSTQSKTYNQLGIGWKDYAVPSGFDENIIKKIRSVSDRKIIFRVHPNSKVLDPVIEKVEITNGLYSRKNIYKDLENAWVTVVWTSNAATESLLAGIPVVVCGPGLYLKDACNMSIDKIKNPDMPDNRLQLFNRMAWAQYNINEVESGFMFNCLLT